MQMEPLPSFKQWYRFSSPISSEGRLHLSLADRSRFLFMLYGPYIWGVYPFKK
jgi:hypothetical protein